MTDQGLRMKNPAHPGGFVREIFDELSLNVTEAAAALQVSRPVLSNLVNVSAALSPEKAFGVSMDTLMRMQNNYDIAQARSRQDEIIVQRYIRKNEPPQARIVP